MSELANQERATKQRWAVPGSSHDRVVRFAKIALPSAVGVVIAFLAMAPLDNRGDVSFILDKNEVEQARERMRVEQARYTGEDNKGQSFLIVADRAVQQSSNVPIVTIEGMRARLNLARGPLSIAALKGRYDLEEEMVAVDGPIRVVGPDGYRLATRDVTVNLDDRTMQSKGAVSGEMPLGRFQAGRLSADLDERTVRLNGGVRLKIVQGAVR